MEATRRTRLEPRTSRSRVRDVNRSATHAALRVISIKFLLVISCFVKKSGHENYRYDHTRLITLIFHQLLRTTSRGTQRIFSSKQIFSRNLPKCLNWWPHKVLFILFLLFLGIFFKISHWVPLHFSGNCVKLCVIQPVLRSFNSSLPWKFISSHVNILEFCTLFYS